MEVIPRNLPTLDQGAAGGYGIHRCNDALAKWPVQQTAHRYAASDKALSMEVVVALFAVLMTAMLSFTHHCNSYPSLYHLDT